MSKILFTVLVVCFAQLAICRVAREAPTTASPWIEAFNMANETFEAFHKSFLNIAGVSNDAEFWNKAKGQFDTFQNTLKSSVDSLTEETKPLQGQAQELFKSFVDKVTEVGNELKAKNPELFSGDVKKLQEVGEKSINTIMTETKKLQERLQKEGTQITPKIEATMKQVYDSALKTAQDFKTQAETAINSIAKKN